MNFEEKKFVQISTLMARWDCGRDLILDMMSEGTLKPWHPRGHAGKKGVRIDVQSVIIAEESGYIEFAG